jgi:hypothetical protein
MDEQNAVISTEIERIGITIREALKATGLDFALGFNAIRNTSRTKEGTGYGAFFTVMVDLGMVGRPGGG